MIDKEKAEELVLKHLQSDYDYETLEGVFYEYLELAKGHALITVDNILDTLDDYASRQMLTSWANSVKYWHDVKKEIESL